MGPKEPLAPNQPPLPPKGALAGNEEPPGGLMEAKVPLVPIQPPPPPLPLSGALASRALQVPQDPQDSTGAPPPHPQGVVADDDEEPQGALGGVPSDRCGAIYR